MIPHLLLALIIMVYILSSVGSCPVHIVSAHIDELSGDMLMQI